MFVLFMETDKISYRNHRKNQMRIIHYLMVMHFHFMFKTYEYSNLTPGLLLLSNESFITP